VAPYFEKKFEIQTLKKGNELVMKCKAFGDKVIQTYWTRDRQSIVFEQESRYVLKEHVHEKYVESFLQIISVDRRDSALFTCTAENSFGKDSINFQILVQG
jgi:cell adhesion molecule, putative (fragment)